MVRIMINRERERDRVTIRWTERTDSYLIKLLPFVVCRLREYRNFLSDFCIYFQKKWSMNDEGDEGREISCKNVLETHVRELISCWNFPVTISSGKYVVFWQKFLVSVIGLVVIRCFLVISMLTCENWAWFFFKW